MIKQVKRRGPVTDIYNVKRLQKIMLNWQGPLEISSIVSDVSVRIMDLIKRGRLRKVYINNLKLYIQIPLDYLPFYKGLTIIG